MLIKASGAVHSGFYLLTLGENCRYLAGLVLPEPSHCRAFMLFDPGLSAHIPYLEKRLSALGMSLADVQYVLVTHLHADRAGGIPLLKHYSPNLKLLTSPQMQSKLISTGFLEQLYEEDAAASAQFPFWADDQRLSWEEYSASFEVERNVHDSDLLQIDDDLAVRVISTPGHTPESLAYLIEPYRVLIVDEGLGYYQGRNLSAPGGDYSLELELQSIEKILKLDLSALCFPNTGVLVGQLVRKHLQSVTQNIGDLKSETEKALAGGVPLDQIIQAISTSFYASLSSDPLLRRNLAASCQAVLAQLLKEAVKPA